MSNVEPTTSRTFFPNQQTAQNKAGRLSRPGLIRNETVRRQHLERTTKNDAKVDIPEAIKDFARIKKAVDAAPQVNNADKIASLKEQIKNGTYQVNYEALADKLLEKGFL